jgi:hypothetical protein
MTIVGLRLAFNTCKGDDMNAAELVERVAAEHGIAKEHARKIIDHPPNSLTK